MHTRKAIAGLTAACIIGAVPAATAATSKPAQPAGTSYVASTEAGGVAIIVSRDRRMVREAMFAYKQTCNDGDTVYNYDAVVQIPMSGKRTFKYSYDSGPQASPSTPGATYQYTTRISGTMNRLGTRIVGTARSTYAFTNPAGGSYTCDSGQIAFKADD